MNNRKRTLVIQGGGFRTGFSTGVLDALQTYGYNDFDLYVGVSGGSIALSYFLSGQYRRCFDAMCHLAMDRDFMKMHRIISSEGIMNIDYFHKVATEMIPFDVNEALERSNGRQLAFVLTDRQSGRAEYFQPCERTWVDAVIASCTLPFVTKGLHILNGKEYMDGGWSDPLPVEWAYNNGAKDILVIRTSPAELKSSQSWPDYFGTLVFRSNSNLRKCFETNHIKYNASIDFIANPPEDLTLRQIAPERPLRAGTYSNSIEAITADYRYGLDAGIEFLRSV